MKTLEQLAAEYTKRFEKDLVLFGQRILRRPIPVAQVEGVAKEYAAGGFESDLIFFGTQILAAERARTAARLRDAWEARAAGSDSFEGRRKRLILALLEELEKS
jgi:hypothetical protein